MEKAPEAFDLCCSWRRRTARRREETARIADEESQNDRGILRVAMCVCVCVLVSAMRGWVENNEKTERNSPSFWKGGIEGTERGGEGRRAYASRQTDGERNGEVREIKRGE